MLQKLTSTFSGLEIKLYIIEEVGSRGRGRREDKK
jgi:hypothetical protein